MQAKLEMTVMFTMMLMVNSGNTPVQSGLPAQPPLRFRSSLGLDTPRQQNILHLSQAYTSEASRLQQGDPIGPIAMCGQLDAQFWV
jgi:hypothetical protein